MSHRSDAIQHRREPVSKIGEIMEKLTIAKLTTMLVTVDKVPRQKQHHVDFATGLIKELQPYLSLNAALEITAQWHPTERQYFAAEAMQALLIGVFTHSPTLNKVGEFVDSKGVVIRDFIKDKAFEMADAMIEISKEKAPA